MNARALLAILALCCAEARAQSFDRQGLGDRSFGGFVGAEAPGFAVPQRGAPLVFPKDHGAHPDYRIEWWYLTANLKGADGESYGVQWTLFRYALTPDAARTGWDDRNIWMGHAAATSATAHVFAQKIARGGVGQAGVEATPFRAYIDDWTFETRIDAADAGVTRLRISARATNFSYALDLDADAPLALQGDKGFSLKSEAGQASYYYSQPFFRVEGALSINGRERKVSGRAWMDREWSSQALGPDQKGWDWFSLHLAGGEKLMLYRLRAAKGTPYISGNWIAPDGSSAPLLKSDISIEPLAATQRAAGRIAPTRWRLKVGSRGFDVETRPLNEKSWVGADFPYWEGPIRIKGSHDGEGYLEMTGY